MPLGVARVGLTTVRPESAGEVTLGTTAFIANTLSGDAEFSNAHELESGVNLLLLAYVHQRDGFVTGITYDSVGATLLREEAQGNRRASVFYILGTNLPSPGANKDIVVANGARGYLTVVPLFGAAQAAPAHDGDTVSGTSLGPTSVSLGANGMAFQFGRTVGTQAGSVSLGSNETHISGSPDDFTSGTTLVTAWSSRKTVNGSFSVSWGSSADGVHIVVGVDPA